MYDTLSTAELTELRQMLYTATERAYWAATLAPGNRAWLAWFQPVYTELARLFLEVGQEQRVRSLDAHELLETLGSLPAAKAA
jgi:hypothetical protein